MRVSASSWLKRLLNQTSKTASLNYPTFGWRQLFRRKSASSSCPLAGHIHRFELEDWQGVRSLKSSLAYLKQEASNSSARRWSAWPRLGQVAGRSGQALPFVRRRLRSRQGAIPEALRQASVRRSSGRSTSVPLPRGHASSRTHALVDGTFRVLVREPEREIVRWGPGRAWHPFLANGSIAATGRAAPGRRPPRIT
jgi:hypothetical protein